VPEAGGSGEITGGSFPHSGMYYNITCPERFWEGSMVGFFLWRADEQIIPGRHLDYNQYSLANLTLPVRFYWLDYKGHWGTSKSVLMDDTSYWINFEVSFGPWHWESTVPRFDDSPHFPSGRDPDDFGKVVMYGDYTSEKFSGSVSNPVNWLFRYAVLGDTHVELKIFDGDGRLTRTLVNSVKHTGYYEVEWYWSDNQGKPVSQNNQYYYQFHVDPDNLLMRNVALIEK